MEASRITRHPRARVARAADEAPCYRWIIGSAFGNPRIASFIKRHAHLLPHIALIALCISIFLRAWVAEDAYITFRVIDNFLHGYGLRWNVHERVQVYTHPLWMLLQIPLAGAWGNVFLTSITMSLLCSFSALIVSIRTVRRPALITLTCFLMPLYFSKAFMDYTSSGLENALSYLLFAVFGHVLLNYRTHPRFWLYLSLSVALALFNRLDVVILYAPVLLWLVATNLRTVRWGQVILGATPLMMWFAFSLFYYGFLFPNTKYAKLNTDLEWSLFLNQGINYIKQMLAMDVAGALLVPLSFLFFRSKDRLPQCLALGILCYSLYIVSVGGDYMGGRFWALPIFISVWMIHAFIPFRMRQDYVVAFACLMLTAWMIKEPIGMIRKSCPSCLPVGGKILTAPFTFRRNALVLSRWPLRIRDEGEYHFASDGKKLAEQLTDIDEGRAEKKFFVGMPGFYAGPKAVIIDELGLADPLLARLPAIKRQRFFIGHFRRAVPKGYYYAIDTGSLERMPPNLALYYEKLRLITAGNLLDKERLKTIILFNLGSYDHWKEEYIKNAKL